MPEQFKFTRREFLKDAAIASAAMATSGVFSATPAAAAPIPAKWDKEAEVVVVGYGGAGGVAAIVAKDAGADVLILEKVPSDASLGVDVRPSGYKVSGGGGNSSICGGGGGWQPKAAAGAAAYAHGGSWGTTSMAVCQAWAEAASKNKAWLDKVGIPATLAAEPNNQEFEGLPKMESSTIRLTETRKDVLGAGGGVTLFARLDEQVQKRKIPILFNSPATDLIQDPATREILGVKAKSDGKDLYVKAKKAVILCTGGFEYNEAMKLDFLRSYPVHFYGWKWNTGDGIKMAQKVGAGIWHMNVMSGRFVAWFPEYEMSPGTVGASYGIHVDKYGKRFANENAPGNGHSYWLKSVEFNLSVPEYARIPAFYIFDENARKKGPVIQRSNKKGPNYQGGTLLPPALGGFPWVSEDNSAEIAKGWIQQGNTIADLVAAINKHEYIGYADPVASPWGKASIPVKMDPAVLSATISTWNGYVAAGKDAEFGRTAPLTAIQTPPFYAIPVWPGGPNTQGGPIRNERAQVCDPDYKPIPRLYSNGECGSFWGMLYEGGGDITELIAFGQIAGANAAAEKPWDAKA